MISARPWSKASTPQTFLLTPKLLNNLQYTEDCTVLCIFNGPWIEEMAKHWQGRCLNIAHNVIGIVIVIVDTHFIISFLG